jgi:hypothetical protein
MITNEFELNAFQTIEEEKKEEEAESKVEKKAMEELTNVLKSLQSQNSEMKDLMKSFLEKATESAAAASKPAVSPQPVTSSPTLSSNEKLELIELKNELKRLKATMLDNKILSQAIQDYFDLVLTISFRFLRVDGLQIQV